MNIIRHIRRELFDGEAVPAVPSLYEQIAAIRGGIVHVVAEPPASVQESIGEDGDDEGI